MYFRLKRKPALSGDLIEHSHVHACANGLVCQLLTELQLVQSSRMAANMPIDAWAKVFKFLEPPPDWPSLCLQDGDSIEPRDQQDALGTLRVQATFWQLPAVCKTFRCVLNEHSGLGCHVFSDTKLARQSCFLYWLQVQAAKVQSLAVVCEPHTGEPHHIAECLQALLHPLSILTFISLRAQVLPKLDLLAQFTSVTACSFAHS